MHFVHTKMLCLDLRGRLLQYPCTIYVFCYCIQVNLPAHLVVIKSTMHYIGGMFQECSESQILQMIGRAGRPQVKINLVRYPYNYCNDKLSITIQFDTTATAVIMTRNSTKVYTLCVHG